jgi:cellulose synthase/poly-beta-1,6-N-acetylglucosamine synthase-like glycosyltransferase
MQTLTFILFFVWAAAMILSIWAVEIARMFARRIQKAHLNPSAPAPNPPAVTIILPIKDVENDTPANLRALLNLAYPRLRFIFALESELDPAHHLLQQLLQSLPKNKAQIVIAGQATARGQKIHNQLAAIDQTTPSDEILLFVDADAKPNDAWLPALVNPLLDPAVGATTGYRLYVPDSPKPSVASIQVSIINASIAALLGPPHRNLAWGGSMAITRKNFFDLGIYDAWQHALSDDYVLSLQIKRVHKKLIRFSHSCFVPSSADFTWKSFFEFAARQYKITKVCAPSIWFISLIGSLIYLVAFNYPLVLWAYSIATGEPDHRLLLMFAAIYASNIIRGYFLYQGTLLALPQYKKTLKPLAFYFTLGIPLSLFTNFLALLKSSVGRTIQWRNITYTMNSPTDTIVHREPQPIPHPAEKQKSQAEEPAEMLAK